MTPRLLHNDNVSDGMACSHDLAERVQREAAEATAFPWWFWEAAVAVFLGTLALSAAFPWGLAP